MRALIRLTQKRDILIKRPRRSQGMRGELRVDRRAPPIVFSASDVPLPEH